MGSSVSNRRSDRAFNIIEVMMSVAILAVAILGVLSAVAFGLRSAAYGQRVSEATTLARQTSEILRATGAVFGPSATYLNTPAVTQANWNSEADARLDSGAIFAHIDDRFPNANVYRRRIETSQVGSTGFDDYLYLIKVTIYFYERGSIRQVQMVSLTRRPR